MSILRVFHEAAVPPAGEAWALDREETHHLVRVRRARPGDAVEVLDGRGHRAQTTLIDARGNTVTLRTESISAEPATVPRIHLYLALAKAKAFELAVQKAAELGAASVVPVATTNCEVGFSGERAASKVGKWRAIAVESLKQCGNPWLPRISAPVTFPEALAAAAAGPRLIAALHPAAKPVTAALAGEHPAGIDIFIGPEGDFTTEEYEAAFAAGCVPVTLASTVLRVETAAVAALAVLVQHGLPDLSGVYTPRIP
ncbi:MAG: 16S rRNA (uracil(1498)-N(3))-methyltransferase [Opitutales bacterium]|nr:16S rRNA (uracil(1498)-N(3))-methyltransferase [Opitutales bacterium]